MCWRSRYSCCGCSKRLVSDLLKEIWRDRWRGLPEGGNQFSGWPSWTVRFTDDDDDFLLIVQNGRCFHEWCYAGAKRVLRVARYNVEWKWRSRNEYAACLFSATVMVRICSTRFQSTARKNVGNTLHFNSSKNSLALIHAGIKFDR